MSSNSPLVICILILHYKVMQFQINIEHLLLDCHDTVCYDISTIDL